MSKSKSLQLLQQLALVAVFLISFAVFKIIFEGIPNGSFYQNAVAALMGALITVSITSILLRQQAKVEEIRERNVEVFKKKVEYYERLTELLIDVLEDGKIDPAEARQIQKSIYSVSLFCSTETLTLIGKFLRQNTIGDTGETLDILDILSQLRQDLKLEGIEKFEKEDLEPIESLINSNFEQLPVYQEIQKYLQGLQEKFDEQFEKQNLPFDMTDIEGTSDGVSFTIVSDSSLDVAYNCNITYPKTNEFSALYFEFFVASSGFLFSKNEEKFIDTLLDIKFTAYQPDEEEDFDVFGEKKIKLSYKYNDNKLSIKKYYTRIVKEVLHDIKIIEESFSKKKSGNQKSPTKI